MNMNLNKSEPAGYLREEFARQQALFDAQPQIVQRFLEAQAQRLAEALLQNAAQANFQLPDRVMGKTPQHGELAVMLLPEDQRAQRAGGWRVRLGRQSLLEAFRQQLARLEQSPDQAINTSAVLLRHTVALHLLRNRLPAGRPVHYRRAEDDEPIPSIPVEAGGQPGSALTLASDAIVDDGPVDDGRAELFVPYVPAARRFFQPRWVAFDDSGRLLVHSLEEARACLASMEEYMRILHTASSLASYLVADEEYQLKRYGMLGQITNQGRALARYQVGEIIRNLAERASAGHINRGVSLSLPYFDDQELSLAEINLEIIPAGRITFKPVFVLRAAWLEQARISQDMRLSISTRRYLLREIEMLEQAFTAR